MNDELASNRGASHVHGPMPSADGYSMLRADSIEMMLTAICEDVEAKIGSNGWDALPMLWVVMPADVPHTYVQTILGDAMDDKDAVAGVVAFRTLPVMHVEGHPRDVLTGRYLDDFEPEAVGAMLTWEGWGAPAGSDSSLRPSEHPDRYEMRVVQLVLRDGTEVSVCRKRGGAVETMRDGHASFNAGGTMAETLRLFVGAPSRAVEHVDIPPADVLWRREQLLFVLMLGAGELGSAAVRSLDPLLSAACDDALVTDNESLRVAAGTLVRLMMETAAELGSDLDEMLGEYLDRLGWWDGDAAAAQMHLRHPEAVELAARLHAAVLCGKVTPQVAARMSEAAALPDPSVDAE